MNIEENAEFVAGAADSAFGVAGHDAEPVAPVSLRIAALAGILLLGLDFQVREVAFYLP